MALISCQLGATPRGPQGRRKEIEPYGRTLKQGQKDTKEAEPMKVLRLVGAIALIAAMALPASAAANQSKNVHQVAAVKYWGGSHLAFGNGFAYAGNWDGRGERPNIGGVRIMDITGTPRQVGFFKCPGDDVDVAYVKPGVIAVGHHAAKCNRPEER